MRPRLAATLAIATAAACGDGDSGRTATGHDSGVFRDATTTVDGNRLFADAARLDGGSVADGGAESSDLADAGSMDSDGNDASDGQSDAGPIVGASVLQFHNHINRDGFFVDPALKENKVATLHIDPTFDGSIVGSVYGQPLYVEHGVNGHGTYYVVTESDNVYALDEFSGKPIWQQTMGIPAQQTGVGCGNIQPLGITGTPAIDLATRTIVFNAVTADSGGTIGTHTIYGLSIDDGSERWHLDVSTLVDQMGRAFSPKPQSQRSAVLIVGGAAYVVYGGHAGDCGTYHGWIVGVQLTNPATVVTYSTPIQGAGMWGPGGPASDGKNIFAATGNREDASSVWGGSEGILRLGPDLSFSSQPNDYFVPSAWDQTLDPGDLDLGGSGPLVVDVPSLTPSALVLAQGKDGNVYALDRTNLGGISTANVGTLKPVNGAFVQAGAFATVAGTTYVVLHTSKGSDGLQCPNGTGGDIIALKFDPSIPEKMTTAWCANEVGQGSPIITTSDGQADPMLWVAGAEDSSLLRAWDLTTGKPIVSTTDAIPNLRRYTTLIDVKGRVLAAADNRVYAFTP